jgi:hypothetical protein
MAMTPCSFRRSLALMVTEPLPAPEPALEPPRPPDAAPPPVCSVSITVDRVEDAVSGPSTQELQRRNAGRTPRLAHRAGHGHGSGACWVETAGQPSLRFHCTVGVCMTTRGPLGALAFTGALYVHAKSWPRHDDKGGRPTRTTARGRQRHRRIPMIGPAVL